MTVSELIEQLSRYTGKLTVYTEGPDGTEHEVHTVLHLPATLNPHGTKGGHHEARVFVL